MPTYSVISGVLHEVVEADDAQSAIYRTVAKWGRCSLVPSLGLAVMGMLYGGAVVELAIPTWQAFQSAGFERLAEEMKMQTDQIMRQWGGTGDSSNDVRPDPT